MLRFPGFDRHFAATGGRVSSYTFRVFSPAFDAGRQWHKTITIFICRRYNRPQSQFSNQKSIANENINPTQTAAGRHYKNILMK